MNRFWLSTLTISGLLLTSATLADATAGKDDSAVLYAIKNNTDIVAQNLKAMRTADANARQHDYQQQLSNSYEQNQALYNALANKQSQTNAATQSDVSNTLAQMTNTPPKQTQTPYQLAQLNASDSLSTDSSSIINSFWHSDKGADTSNDPTFNFGTIIDKTAYPMDADPKHVNNKQACDKMQGHFVPNFAGDDSSGMCTFSTQYLQANNYLTYLTDSYQPLVSGLQFSKLGNDKDAIKQLNNDEAYIKLKNKVRGMVAQRSIALDNLHAMMQERIVQPGLGEKLGITDKDGKSVKDASILQAEQYAVDSKLNNPDWYKKIATESSPALQRQTLIALLGIQRQMQQQHIDNERMIATQSAMVLGLANMQKMLLQTSDVKEVNESITRIAKSG